MTLPSDREILVVRDFRAPRRLVFEAWSKPEHVRRWYPCSNMTMSECDIDFRVGGRWRWVQKTIADGRDHPISGEYIEIDAPNRLVFTSRYEPIAGSDHVVTVTFEEHGGITTMRERYEHPSRINRDQHLSSGMETGLAETFLRLDQVLTTIGAAEVSS